MSSDEYVEDLDGDEEILEEDELDADEIDDDVDDSDDDTDGEDEDPKKKKRLIGALLVGILSLGLIGGGLTLGIMSMRDTASDLKDMTGRIAVPEDQDNLTKEFLDEAEMIIDEGGKGFEIPAAGLNVPLGAINPVKGVLNPPNFTSAFWIRKIGSSPENGDRGTVFIVTHSLRAPGQAPGNFYQRDGEVTLNPGDYIKVRDRVYVFTESEIVLKTELGRRDDVWANVPGRLVVITCHQNQGSGATISNVILYGELVS
jgi:hypothetical protein